MKTSNFTNSKATVAHLPLSTLHAAKTEKLGLDEQRELEKCEHVLRTGLATFFEVGQALLTIRNARLYRHDFSTFEAYCHQRWAMGRNYAWHLIGAAERVRLLPSDSKTPRPINEFQVRPFLRLEPEAFPKAWEQVVLKARNGKITPALVRGVVAQIEPRKRPLHTNGSRSKKANRLPKGCSVGAILVLLTEARMGLEKNDTKKAMEIIDRIELELLGMCK